MLDDPLQKTLHSAYLGDPRESVEPLLAQVRSRRWDLDPWSPFILDATDRVMLGSLVSLSDPRWAPVELLRVNLERGQHGSLETHARRLEALYERFKDSAPRWACLAATRRARAFTHRPDTREWVLRARRSACDAECDLAAGAASSYLSLLRGELEEARREAVGWRDVTPTTETRWAWAGLVNSYAMTLPIEEGVGLLRGVLDAHAGDGVGVLHVTLSALLGELGDLEGAARHGRLGARGSSGDDKLAALSNQSLALLMLGRREQAKRVTVLGISKTAAYPDHAGFFHRALLATHTDWPDRTWESFWALLPDCSDGDAALMCRLGAKWATSDGRPDRARVLLAEADRLAAAR